MDYTEGRKTGLDPIKRRPNPQYEGEWIRRNTVLGSVRRFGVGGPSPLVREGAPDLLGRVCKGVWHCLGSFGPVLGLFGTT